MVVDQAAPVQHVKHGLVAEHGLLLCMWVIWQHSRACCQLHQLVCLCPSHLLQPDLSYQNPSLLYATIQDGTLSPLLLSCMPQHVARSASTQNVIGVRHCVCNILSRTHLLLPRSMPFLVIRPATSNIADASLWHTYSLGPHA